MPVIKRLYNSTMSSVQALEDRCNFDELNLPGRLQSLRADNSTGVKFTVAEYEQLDDVDGVGNLDLNKSPGAKDSAFIMTVETDVSITRT
jgi:hypothetical protein